MNVYTILVNGYNALLAGFPEPVRWFITLLLLVGLVYTFIQLISANALFIILLVVLLPAIIPILVHFLMDIYNFFLYLLAQMGLYKPAG
jgi:Flp pilus assembly protein TadB